MMKVRIIMSLLAVGTIVVLFLLPRVVVETDEDKSVAGGGAGQAAVPVENDVVEQHNANLDTATQKQIGSLRKALTDSEDYQKSLNFADSLAAVFKEDNRYDSAAVYYGLLAQRFPSVDTWLTTGNAYYDAYTFAMDEGKRKQLGQKAREYYSKVLQQDSNVVQAQVRSAMTLLSAGQPMQGILALRDIAEKYPENQEALYNLGVFSIQTRQFEKGLERFRQLTKVNPKHIEGTYYLGVCYAELGLKEEAIEALNKVKTLTDDPAVIATVDTYLKDIK